MSLSDYLKFFPNNPSLAAYWFMFHFLNERKSDHV